ncbi:lysoplasmalogenase family protein [Anditalea andensis]|uniref:YhhN-like protein n=1 Tax=Anditalea andensis TaxID=1048983 RepID=A0A074L4I5_9BACT|nr:lysoplasmalogenase family protein [Anditalea andensis]KEO74773.1 hypothetical protein EL17_03600 [Anditalea andensis]
MPIVLQKPTFIYAFILLLTIAVTACIFEWPVLHYGLRIILVPFLMYFFIKDFKKFEHALIPLLITATFFKYIGDIFFMVEMEENLFNLFAICTFIVANVGYGLMFYFSYQKKQKLRRDSYFIPEIIWLVFITVTLSLLLPYFGMYQIPAVIYTVFSSFTLCAMTRRRKYLRKKTYWTVFLGTTFLFTSDILHALGVFYNHSIHDSLILVFFTLGHYFIIKGMTVQFKDELHHEKILMKNIHA